MIAFARAHVLAILRQHGLTKSGTAAQQNPPPPTGISNRIAAALDGERVAGVVDVAERCRRFEYRI